LSLVIITAVDSEDILPIISTALAVKVLAHSANDTEIEKKPVLVNPLPTTVVQL